MRPPPFLLGAALIFWGWQSNYLVAGLLMAVVIESPQWLKARWEFSHEDFTRIWIFCSLLLLAAAVYSFTDSQATSDFFDFLRNPSFAHQRNAGTSSARAAAALTRWLPIIFFPFIAAQAFSIRQEVPLETVSLILRWRWKKARKLGQPSDSVSRSVNVGFVYFGLCLFSASIHPGEDGTYFWGLCVLVGCALWAQRSRRFQPAIWVATLAAAVLLGFLGQLGLTEANRYLSSVNPLWFTEGSRRGFDPTESKTSLGEVSGRKASSQIVVRLEPREGGTAPPYLREASYRIYKNKTWLAGPSRDDFQGVQHETTNETTFVLLPGKSLTATVNIACYLPGNKALLPLPEGVSELDNLPAFVLHKNSAGAVLAEGPGVVIFDARYGPGETIDGPPEAIDFEVPPRESPALEEVISQLSLRDQKLDLEHKLRIINSFFQTNFTYSLWQEPDSLVRTNETALGRFLLRSRKGHCEYFATATVLLLRQLQIPARYAVGYAVHEAAGRKYLVRQRDAHAWCLVYRGSSWRTFDTTPGSWLAAEASRKSSLQPFWDFWSQVGFELSRIRWGQSNLREYVFWGLVPILLLLLYQIVVRTRRRRQTVRPSGSARPILCPGLDSEFYQVEKSLVQRGFDRLPGEALSVWLARVGSDPALSASRQPLNELLTLHYRYRFDPEGLTEAERDHLRRQSRACLEEIAMPR